MQVTIAEFVELKFSPKSRPSPEVVRKWIQRGQLPYPAQRLGGRWYIELDAVPEKAQVDPLFLKVIHGD